MQIVISGLVFGCIYGLTALGLVLIYRTTKIVNFSQGEMAMMTTFMCFTFLTQYEMPYFIAFLLSLIFAGIFGLVIQQGVMKRVQDAPHLNQVVLTLGMFIILNGVAGLIWGHQPTGFPKAIDGDSFNFAGVFVSPNEIFVSGLTIVLMLFFFILFRYTKIGLAMRSSSQDVVASQLMGIKVNNVFAATWIVGSVLGGVAGIMTAPLVFLDTHMMGDVLIMAFAGAVLGGFISLPGAVLGGLIIGIFANLVSFYIAPELKVVYTFLLIILVLYIRPQGIFGGKPMVKKV